MRSGFVRRQSALAAACLLAGALVSLRLGQDANWDLLAYHLQNGAALLHGRFQLDLLPVGLQSYLNPLLDASYAWLALGPLHAHPRALASVMGLWYGAALYLVIRLAARLHGGWTLPMQVGVVLAVSGVAMATQVGTTTGELQVGVFMLAGLLVLLARPPGPSALLMAGLLFGAAAGLKLTALAMAPAACLAAASLHTRRRMIGACALFTAAWAAGLLATDGWWAWRVYQRFGSPTFPMFNGVFRSPWYPPASMVDDRFFPRGLLQWLAYPLFWTRFSAVRPSEQAFQDLRAAVALCLAVAVFSAWAAGRWLPALRRPSWPPAARAALVFLGVGYLTWLTTSAILRYAVVLEAVAGLAVPLLLARLLRGRLLAGGLAAVLALVFATTRYPPPWRMPYAPLRADMGWVEPGMLVIVTFRGPSGHVLALMPQRAGVSVVQLGAPVLEARGWKLHDAVRRMVSEREGRIVVLTEGHPLGRFPELAEIGLDPWLSGCRPVDSTLAPAHETGLHVCDTRRVAPPALASPFWAQAARHYRTLFQPADDALDLIGESYLQAAGPAARGTRFVDWADSVWGGTRRARDVLPPRLDPATLTVAAPSFALKLAQLVDPARDLFGVVDGRLVAAPGWRVCAACTAPVDPVPLATLVPRLAPGGSLDEASLRRSALLDGWWAGEDPNLWSHDHAGLLLALAPGFPPTFTLTLSGTAFTTPAHPMQHVIVAVAGHPDSAVTQGMARQGSISIRLQRDWLKPTPDGSLLLQLRLDFPDAASPSQLGLSADTRVLGFALSGVKEGVLL